MGRRQDGSLTAERLRELLHYDPLTGLWTWLVNRGLAKVGDVAGTTTRKQYVQIGIDGCLYRSHRLAFLYINGEWPNGLVDHKNNDGFDNRWDNLREATFSQNAANGKVHRDSASGYKGVSWSKRNRKWRVDICISRKRIHVGNFTNIEDAIAAYAESAGKLFGEFATL